MATNMRACSTNDHDAGGTHLGHADVRPPRGSYLEFPLMAVRHGRSTGSPLRLTHSALCTRVLLNLRKAATPTDGAVSGAWDHMGTIAFASHRSETESDWDEVELRSPTLASGSGWGSDRRTIIDSDSESEDTRV